MPKLFGNLAQSDYNIANWLWPQGAWAAFGLVEFQQELNVALDTPQISMSPRTTCRPAWLGEIKMYTKMTEIVRMLVLLGVVSAGAIMAHAQAVTASLTGTVKDGTGAVLPAAQVVVRNTDTGVSRSVNADETGNFRVADLKPGPYEVTVTAAGFQTLVRSGITLLVGQLANLPLTLNVGAVAEQVTVTGELPLINTTGSAVSGVVEQERIESLPLNGRDFSQLPLIQPGVAAVRNGDVVVSKGYGARLAMGGSRPDQTAWLVDGTNINSPSNFGTPGSAAGVMLGVEAVREFQVLTSNYSAELGGTSGGVINMVTKSGTNTIHGSAYEFLRNDKLDARNFFDGRQKPAFKRNQFGFSLGGPIKQDNTFFFGNYEGLRQRQGNTLVSTVLDADVHRGIVPGSATPIAIAPIVKPFLDYWPLPNGDIVRTAAGAPSGTAILSVVASTKVREDYFVTRGDHRITDKQSIFARVTFDQGNFTQPELVPVYENVVSVHSRYSTIQHDYVVSPGFLTTSRVAYNRTLMGGTEVPLGNHPAGLNVFNPDFPPTVTIPGATTIGPPGTNLLARVQNWYNFQEDIQMFRGRHSIKTGVSYSRIGTNIFNQLGALPGTLTWATIPAFLQDQTLQAFTGVAQGSDPYRSFRQQIFGVYAQDDWKMTQNFTWNLGIRYEPFSAPTEKHDRMSTVRDWVTDTAFTPGIGLFKTPSKKNFSPRLGFAWAPGGDGKTAVRAGFGIFYVNILSAYYGTPGGKNPPYAASTAAVLGNLATSIQRMKEIDAELLRPAFTPSTLMDFIQYDLDPTYEMKYNFSLERQLAGGVAVTVGYLGNRGIHLWRLADANNPAPITVDNRPFVVNGLPRPNRLVGAGTVRYSDAQGFYNALQMEAKKRFSHGFQFQTAYTWSRNIDDSTTGVAQTDFTPGTVGNTTQPHNPKADRSRSSLDIGQTFVVNGVFEIPSPTETGIAGALLHGWQVAGIFSASEGAPFTVYVSGRNAPDQTRQVGFQHPDLDSSRSFDSIVVGDPNRYFDATAFRIPPPAPAGFAAGSGFYGNAGRNIIEGPGLTSVDVSFQKTTHLPGREGLRLEFQANFFNLLNRANFANPRGAQSQVINPTNGSYIAGAGKITNTVTSSRQMQFGLKLAF